MIKKTGGNEITTIKTHYTQTRRYTAKHKPPISHMIIVWSLFCFVRFRSYGIWLSRHWWILLFLQFLLCNSYISDWSLDVIIVKLQQNPLIKIWDVFVSTLCLYGFVDVEATHNSQRVWTWWNIKITRKSRIIRGKLVFRIKVFN